MKQIKSAQAKDILYNNKNINNIVINKTNS